MSEFVVGVRGGKLQLQNEAVNLVQTDCDGEFLLDSMLQESLCVQHYLCIQNKSITPES